ncbi:MAG: TetR/AcrR family transcriptional regulator [Mycobacteriales bacterium]
MPTRRIGRSARRVQLLDVAAELVMESGLGAVTMEGVAARAHVSKALPYAHFANAEELLVALRARELARFDVEIIDAVASSAEFEVQIQACVSAYFSILASRGRLLAALLAPSTWVGSGAGPRRDIEFFADLFTRQASLPVPVARTAAAVMLAGMHGATETLAQRRASRVIVERTVTTMILGAIDGLRHRADAE